MPRTAFLSLLLFSLACAGPRPAVPPVPAASPSPSAQAPAPAEGAERTQKAEADLKELLSRIESSYRRGEYDKGLALVKEVLQMKRTDLSSFDRIGSTYFVLGRYAEALTVWEPGLAEQQDSTKRKELASSIALARTSLGLEVPARPRTRKPRGRRTGHSQAPLRPSGVLAALRQGVEHYARGEYLQASSLFMRALELDGANAKAQGSRAPPTCRRRREHTPTKLALPSAAVIATVAASGAFFIRLQNSLPAPGRGREGPPSRRERPPRWKIPPRGDPLMVLDHLAFLKKDRPGSPPSRAFLGGKWQEVGSGTVPALTRERPSAGLGLDGISTGGRPSSGSRTRS